MNEQSTFSKGDKVHLGDGREGKIIGKKERAGFHGYIVEITSSIDKNQIGQTVAATVQNMKKISQIIPIPVQENPQNNPIVTSPVEDVSDDEVKQNEMRKKELQFTRKQVQTLQQKINDLQSLVAQRNPNEPASDQFEELDRIDQADEENLKEQTDKSLAQQEMQQTKSLQDQQMRTQQQMMMNIQPMKGLSASRWVHPERANAKFAFGKTELYCDVAATPKQQASGLQIYNSLPENRGLWFPFMVKRSATFHMGNVKFPIDILFLDNNKVIKIVSNIQPQQMGSWSAICTDVVEVNAGWCEENKIVVGSHLLTPLTGKKRALSEIERDINKSWSAPQEARINSDKEGVATSYDTLRTITTAEDIELNEFEQRMLTTFPFLKSAQEHRQPDSTDKIQPGEVDNRNPLTRYRHNTLPDTENPFGDGDPAHVDPLSGVSNAPFDDGNNSSEFDGNYGKHWKRQIGYDPKYIKEDWPVAVRPSASVAQVTIKSPSPDNELAGVDLVKLANGSLSLYDDYGPEWNDYDTGEEYEGDPGYVKIAIINDETISKWIDSLGFDPEDESKLRKTMFTDEYKIMLGDTLITAGRATDYEIFDSDLLLYK